jgi:UDP-N-acetylmuramate--alanine ligase
VRLPVPESIPPAEELGRVHFVGIGGAGLSGIARVMLGRGVPVSGSDGKASPTLDALAALGARVHVGHSASHLGDADTVVVSTAVREDNPEVVAALAQGLRVWPRSAALQSVLADRRVVAVAGTHGKTTTTSLLTVALLACGADPSYAIGGDLTATGVNAAAGSGELFVAEADESDGAFLVYTPHAAVVTNVEADHLDNWGTEEAYSRAFEEFVDHVDPAGFLVVCGDDPGARTLAEHGRSRELRTIEVGTDASCDLRAEDLSFEGSTSSFDVVGPDGPLGRVTLQIPGHHYVLDALGALAAGLELGFPFDQLTSGLSSFTGTRRRMERKGEVGGVRVYDSYAHHPKEIAGDLQAARSLAGEGRVVVAYQPHLVSRTKIFGAQMGEALGAADEVVVLDVYLAREDPEPGVDGAMVAAHVPLPSDRVRFEPVRSDVPALLVSLARPGDLVLTLGAGDVTELGPEVLRLLTERRGGLT